MEISRENLYVVIGAWEFKYEIQYEFDLEFRAAYLCDSFWAHHVNRRNDRIRTVSQLTIYGTPAWLENLYLWLSLFSQPRPQGHYSVPRARGRGLLITLL